MKTSLQIIVFITAVITAVFIRFPQNKNNGIPKRNVWLLSRLEVVARILQVYAHKSDFWHNKQIYIMLYITV